MEHTRFYSSPEVCRLSGASFRQLDYWARTHRVAPSPDGFTGSGHARRWPLREAGVACALVAFDGALASLLSDAVVLHVREHGLTGTVWIGPFGFDCSQIRLRTLEPAVA